MITQGHNRDPLMKLLELLSYAFIFVAAAAVISMTACVDEDRVVDEATEACEGIVTTAVSDAIDRAAEICEDLVEEIVTRAVDECVAFYEDTVIPFIEKACGLEPDFGPNP